MGAALLRGAAEGTHAGLQLGESGGEGRVLAAAPRQGKVTQAVVEPLVPQRLRGLAAQAADLARDLADDVRHARQVLVGERQLLQRLAPL